MKVWKLISIATVTLWCLTSVHATFLGTALSMGFLGGFLLGKITLGVFLAAMNSLNQRQGTLVTKTDDFSNQLETEIRAKFLHELGKMDPLDCLPKVFCEVSADPKQATKVFGKDAVNLLSHTSPNNKKQEQDNGKNDSDSHSDEQEDEEEEDLNDAVQQEEDLLYKKGLEELIKDYDDPVHYYFALKEKRKKGNIEGINHELTGMMMKDVDFSKRKVIDSSSSPTNILSSWKRLVQGFSMNKGETQKRKLGDTTPAVDTSIEDDPFFHEFNKNSQNPLMTSGMINIGLLRRSRRQAGSGVQKSDEKTMQKYKLAEAVAKSGDTSKCQKVFSSCPFPSDQIMRMITKVSSFEKKPENYGMTMTSEGGDDSILDNLKHVLAAVEKLNVVTSTKNKTSSSETEAAPSGLKLGSQSIEQDDAQTPSEEKVVEEAPKYKYKGKKTEKRRTKRQDMPQLFPMPLVRVRPNSDGEKRAMRPPRIEAPGSGKLVLSKDRDDEFLSRSRERLWRRYDEDSSEEGDSSSEPIIRPVSMEAKWKNKNKSKPSQTQVPSSSKTKPDVEEDDEVNSPESEELAKVPPQITFSQSFIDSLGTPPRTKPRPKPIHKVPKVKPQTRVTKTPKLATTTTTTLRPKRTSPPRLEQKFSGESEDDEAEAINSEKELDVLISKYKPKGKLG